MQLPLFLSDQLRAHRNRIGATKLVRHNLEAGSTKPSSHWVDSFKKVGTKSFWTLILVILRHCTLMGPKAPHFLGLRILFAAYRIAWMGDRPTVRPLFTQDDNKHGRKKEEGRKYTYNLIQWRVPVTTAPTGTQKCRPFLWLAHTRCCQELKALPWKQSSAFSALLSYMRRCQHNTHLGVHNKCPTFLSDFNQIWSLLTDFRTEANKKFYKNLSSVSRPDTCGQTHMTKRTVSSLFAWTRLKTQTSNRATRGFDNTKPGFEQRRQYMLQGVDSLQ
jgi:hypothetical protein